jgi:nitrate reductase assembly molybdenum cofactor insertion protein NarJ
MKKFDIYSALLRYPSDKEIISECIDRLGRAEIVHLKHSEPGNLQEDYVDSFDFSEKSSLLITTHIASGEKDRAGVLAGFAVFRKTYGSADGSASPDYLPDMLNWLQTAADTPEGRTDALLMAGILLRAVEKIADALKKSGGIYLPVVCGLKEELRRYYDNPEVCNV